MFPYREDTPTSIRVAQAIELTTRRPCLYRHSLEVPKLRIKRVRMPTLPPTRVLKSDSCDAARDERPDAPVEARVAVTWMWAPALSTHAYAPQCEVKTTHTPSVHLSRTPSSRHARDSPCGGRPAGLPNHQARRASSGQAGHAAILPPKPHVRKPQQCLQDPQRQKVEQTRGEKAPRQCSA